VKAGAAPQPSRIPRPPLAGTRARMRTPCQATGVKPGRRGARGIMPAMDSSAYPFPLSRLANDIQRSVIRDLIAVVGARPEVISFAGGLPAADRLPLAEIDTCLDAVLTRDGRRALQYGPPHNPLREWIAAYMQRRGAACSVDQVFITSGAQQALEILGRLLLDAGEPAVVEALTFTGIGQVLLAHGAALRVAPFSLVTGVDAEAFATALSSDGRPARLGVVIPDFHNPTGASLPAGKRPALAAAAARAGVPLIEDDPYSLLRYSGTTLPPIKAYDEAGRVLYVSSFSKIIAPAVRLGWIVAPAPLLPRLTVLRESIDLESSQLLQRTVAEFLARGYLEPHLADLNAANRERRDAMLAALDRELGGLAEWTEPEGGIFLWVRLPEGVDAGALLRTALEHQVAFVPGTHFSAEHGFANSLRLNYSNNTPERIHEGLRRLGAALKEYLG
jgi:2-aminoadipate transaminase